MDKTHQVARRVLEMVLGGTHGPGDRIPPEREMARRSGMSRVTVRRAYGYLAASGVLERRQGAGTRIATSVRGCSEDIRQVALLTAGIGEFGLAFLRAIEIEVAAIGAVLVVKTSREEGGQEGSAAMELAARGIRNIVIWPGGGDFRREIFERLRLVGTNMVFFDRVRPGPIADLVWLDNRDAVRRLLEQGVRDGCRAFDFVGYEGGTADSERERLAEFRRWCVSRGVRHAHFTVPWGFAGSGALLRARRGGLGRGSATGVVCTNDALALRVAGVCGRAARIYGIDGYPAAVAAGITTIEQPLARMARTALRLLREQQAKGAAWRAREVRCRGRLVTGSGGRSAGFRPRNGRLPENGARDA